MKRASGGGRGKVLLAAYWYPPENTSGAARPWRFARYLSRFGFEPRVVAAPFDGPDSSDWRLRRTAPAGFSDRARRWSRMAALAQRYLVPYNDRLPWVAPAVETATQWWNEEPYEAILSSSPPLAPHLAALSLKRRLGVRWVADFRDPLRDNPFRTRRWPFPYDAIMERLIFRNADAVVANTEAMAGLWRRRYPQWSGKIHVIWNGYDPADPVEAASFEPRPYRIIAHVGALYGGRHPAALLESLERLIRAGRLAPDTIRVQLTGPIEDGLVARHQAAFDALTRRGVLRYDGLLVPSAEARRVLASCDYPLLLDLNERESGLQVPAKIFEYIRIGRPILAFTATESATRQILEQSGIPHRLVFTGSDAGELDRQVMSLLEVSPEPVRPSAWFEERFNCITQTAALAALLGG